MMEIRMAIAIYGRDWTASRYLGLRTVMQKKRVAPVIETGATRASRDS